MPSYGASAAGDSRPAGHEMTEEPKGPLAHRIYHGGLQYGPLFTLEVIVFYATFMAFELLADGNLSPRRQLALGLLMVLVAWGAAEARFRLSRPGWSVASRADVTPLGMGGAGAGASRRGADMLIPAASRSCRVARPRPSTRP